MNRCSNSVYLHETIASSAFIYTYSVINLFMFIAAFNGLSGQSIKRRQQCWKVNKMYSVHVLLYLFKCCYGEPPAYTASNVIVSVCLIPNYWMVVFKLKHLYEPLKKQSLHLWVFRNVWFNYGVVMRGDSINAPLFTLQIRLYGLLQPLFR